MIPFSLKESWQVNPFQVPQWGPYGEIPAYRAFLPLSQYISFYLSLRVPSKGAPSMFPNRVPTGSSTPSPEPLVYFLFIHSFIHSFMYVCWSPQKGALLHTYGEKQKVIVH